MTRASRIIISSLALGLISALVPGFALAQGSAGERSASPSGTYSCLHSVSGSTLVVDCYGGGGSPLYGAFEQARDFPHVWLGTIGDGRGNSYSGSVDRFDDGWYGSAGPVTILVSAK